MRYILSVLAKRTYRLDSKGQCAPAEEQTALAVEPQWDETCSGLLAQDSDVFPFKPMTDVIVKGNACSAPASASFDVSVHVGAAAKTIRVLGNRRCTLSRTGQILISDPDPIGKVPLRYDRAYGGRDAVAEAKYGNPIEQFRAILPEQFNLEKASPYNYPRNPCGVGFLVEAGADAVERLALPNLEDPEDPLTPERLVAGNVRNWLRMPMPQATDWVAHSWFPRLACFGVLPDFEPPGQPTAEVTRGFASQDILTKKPYHEKFSFRCTNGASLGLQLPYLMGGEPCELLNIHPKQACFRFCLPNDRPKMWTDGRKGKMNETEPVIHTVVIEPDESRLTVLWRGSAPALRPYFPEELARMPFRVEW